MPIDLNEHLKRKREQGGGAPRNDRNDRNDSNRNDDNRQQGPKRRPQGFNFNGGGNIGNFFSSKKGIALIIIIIIVIILIIARPFETIESGEIGIKVTTGKYDNVPLQPGIHFFIPGIQRIIIVDTKVRTWNFTGVEDSMPRANQGILRSGAINVMDARGLTVSIELTVQYQLNAATAPQTIASYGMGWENKIIGPVVLEAVRTVVGNYPAEELPNKRNEIANKIEDVIRAKLTSGDSPAVRLSSVQLREISLPANIRAQIEKVQEARQRSEQAKLEVDIAKQEAAKKIALSKGEAESSITRAKGVAESTIIEAKAKSTANKEIAQSLSNNLLRLREIETQAKFNEALQVNKNAQIMLLPGGAVPNIWVDSKSKAYNSIAAPHKESK
ncbi:hypothetical protein BKH43_01010 [Helicobacter sp. 13S00401-1]|uniref:prohibitin family protein n=1 Tax=Helicobacter sp. 13S00401-1 TaxID=1905758 RepID=UPI000BA52D5B|nr:prohibitin family protein [Helicobacter sp. 13S00401-1]PAF51844.1 hypothetical protein BKH43_01010 [Helicobacter sp. 13S00401-1]